LTSQPPSPDIMAPPKDFLVPALADCLRLQSSNIRNLDPTSLCKFMKIAYNQCALQDMEFAECILENCKLLRCIIKTSKITNSSAEKCKIFESSQADTCIFNGCSILNSRFKRCYVEDSTIELLSAIDSHVIGCTVPGASSPPMMGDLTIQLFNCRVEESELSNLAIHLSNSLINTSLYDCAYVRPQLELQKFAPELREIIFRHSVLDYCGLHTMIVTLHRH